MGLSGERCGAIFSNDFQESSKRLPKHRPVALKITRGKPTFTAAKILVYILLHAEELRVKRQQLFRPVGPWRQLISSLNLLVPPITHQSPASASTRSVPDWVPDNKDSDLHCDSLDRLFAESLARRVSRSLQCPV